MTQTDWKKCKLINETISIGDGIHGTPKYDTNSDVFFINGNNLLNGHIHIKEDTKRVSAVQATIHQDILSDRTLLISINGTLGNVAYYCGEPVVLGKSACYVNVNSQNDKKFFYYLFTSPMFQQYLHFEATGTTIKNVSLKSMRNFEFLLPPIEEQKRIAQILGSLDDKIELLQKQNKTLEDMAKAIFKSWFVDFDVVHAKQKGLPKADIMREYHLTDELYDLFPSDFENSSLGPIPLGWQVKNLDSLCERCQSGGTPSTKHEEYWKGGTISWFSTKELQDSFLLNSEKNITEKGLDNSSAKLFPKGTIIMAIYASPTVGRLGILTKESTFNQAAVGFIPNEEMISKEYLFLLLKQRRDDLNNLANGAAQQNLSVGVVKAFNVLIPTKKLNFQYKKIISPLFEKMEFNIKQIQTLTELRDTLLPPLISGKIRV